MHNRRHGAPYYNASKQLDRLMDRIMDRIEEPQAEAQLRRKVKVAFAFAIVLTSLLGSLSWRVAQQSADDAAWVAHTHKVSTTLEATLRHVLDVESGGRGFALTGSEQFLQPYEAGRDAVGQDLQRLRFLIVDTDQQRRLETLEKQAGARIESARNVVTVRQNTGQAPTESQLERGKQLMDAARATIAEMEEAERRLLEQRTGRARAAQRFNLSFIALGALAGVILLSVAGATVSREISISARARAQVNALNANLERRVAQRTAALGESEGRLAGVIQSATDSIITVDEEQRIVLFNSTAERIFLCPAAEALGQPITRFIPQRFHGAHAGHIRTFGDTGVTNRGVGPKGALWALRADGKEFQIEASISQVVTGGKKLFTVILRDITERALMMEARERLAVIVESSDDAIISKTLDGTITAWNRGAEKIFGYSPSEAVGQPIAMLIPPERANEEIDILVRIGRGESVEHFETIRMRKDGKRIDVSATISPIRDNNGVIVGASKVASDITERKQAEKQLSAQAEELAHSRKALEAQTVMFKLVLDNMGEGLIAADRDGRFLIWNKAAHHLMGRGAEDLPTERWTRHYKVFLPDGITPYPPDRLPLGRARRGESVRVELIVQPPESLPGKFLEVTARPLRDAAGGFCGGVAVLHNITERKQVEVALAGQAEELSRQAEELIRSRQALEAQTLMLQSVLGSMGEGLIAVDEKGKFLLWNTAAEKMLGQEDPNVAIEDWPERFGLYLPDTATLFPSAQLPVVRALNGEVSASEMFVRNRALPEGAWIEVSGGPRNDGDGVACGGVVALRNITQRKADEREIRKLNDELEIRVLERTAQLEAANKELEAFSYSVSHDLRAPLRHVSGFSQMLVEELGANLTPAAQGHLDRIQAGTLKMGVLVDELLNLARVGRHALKRRPVKLNAIVTEVVGILESESQGRQVDWMIADLPTVECDPVLVKQIFQNLLANALKFTRPRTRATIEVTQPEKRDAGQRVFMVRDNGIGFSMKYVDKLFGVFQRLHQADDFEGTGIGLATVQRIAQKHGGRVWAEGEVDKGATFYFTLGLEKEAESKSNGATAGGQS
jgi:PAS domain S-box-containing protein